MILFVGFWWKIKIFNYLFIYLPIYSKVWNETSQIDLDYGVIYFVTSTRTH